MSKFDEAFAGRPGPQEAQSSVVSSVQASLYSRLRKRFGASAAGTLGWMCIRLAQDSHRDYPDAVAAFLGAKNEDVITLREATAATARALARTAGAELAAAVAHAVQEFAERKAAFAKIQAEGGLSGTRGAK